MIHWSVCRVGVDLLSTYYCLSKCYFYPGFLHQFLTTVSRSLPRISWSCIWPYFRFLLLFQCRNDFFLPYNNFHVLSTEKCVFFLLSFSWNQLSILSWQRRRVKYIITFWLVGISKSRSAPLCSLHSTLLVRWSVGQSVGRSVIPFQPAFTHEVIPPSLSLSVYPPPLKSQPID